MLLKRHVDRLDDIPPEPAGGFEHLEPSALWTLRWLRASKVDFVLVGPVAASIRGGAGPSGPVAIVPAPYRRNLERLARAMAAEHVCARVEGAVGGESIEPSPMRLSAEMLARSQLRTLRIGAHDLDIEGGASGLPSYQELLYDASRFEVTGGVGVEVAAPEDIERYDHLRRTGIAPEITIRRASESAQAPTEAPRRGSLRD